MLNGHLLDQLVHLVLQFLDAFFINRLCWISHSGTNRLDALALLLDNWILDSFRGNPLSKLGQHLINAGCGERGIPPGLQRKFQQAFFRILLGTLSYIRVPSGAVLNFTASHFANEKNRWVSPAGATTM